MSASPQLPIVHDAMSPFAAAANQPGEYGAIDVETTSSSMALSKKRATSSVASSVMLMTQPSAPGVSHFAPA